jgi:ATPase family associated with various cellular activities (AAA)
MGAVFSFLKTNGAAIITGALGVICYKIIDSLLTLGKKAFFNIVCSKIEIYGENNPKALYAVKQEIELLVNKKNLINMQDGPLESKFSLNYGTYRVKTKELGHVWAEYTKEGINLYTLPEIGIWPPRCNSKIVKLKDYGMNTYKKHCAPSELIMTFTSNKDKWSFPIMRRPTTFKEENGTEDMKKALADIDRFKKNHLTYQDKGVPYRRGYLLYGITGSGKTTIIELAAKKHNMTLYSLNLNSNEMTDTILINLVTTVPPNAMIVLEEIDKQIAALDENQNKYVTMGGLLSAIDGPQRLSYGTIVIMTANSNKFVDHDYKEALFRPGRIDRQIEFTRKLDIKID